MLFFDFFPFTIRFRNDQLGANSTSLIEEYQYTGHSPPTIVSHWMANVPVIPPPNSDLVISHDLLGTLAAAPDTIEIEFPPSNEPRGYTFQSASSFFPSRYVNVQRGQEIRFAGYWWALARVEFRPGVTQLGYVSADRSHPVTLVVLCTESSLDNMQGCMVVEKTPEEQEWSRRMLMENGVAPTSHHSGQLHI
jgi:hypothetical protein